MQHSHCSYCGTAYGADAAWPRVCVTCGETTWRNPLPVAVALLPVDTDQGRGLLVVRRDIMPARGELSLPGGFIELGESWQEAAVRELWEESTITADAADIRLFDAQSTPSGMLLVFGLLPPRPFASLPPSTATDESTGFDVALAPQTLAFPTHTRALAAYFTGHPA